MAHPLMYAVNDPKLARVRRSALTLPGAAEKISHGRPVFFTQRVFAIFGGSTRVEGAQQQHPSALLVLLEEDDRLAYLQRTAFVPAYWGPWDGLASNSPRSRTPKSTSCSMRPSGSRPQRNGFANSMRVERRAHRVELWPPNALR